MNKKLGTILALGLAQAFATTAGAADMVARDPAPTYVERGGDRDGVKIGMLTCDVGGGVGYVIGSAKSVDCVFSSTRGEQDTYSGVIRKMGVDLGFTTQGRIVWAVFAPTAGTVMAAQPLQFMPASVNQLRPSCNMTCDGSMV